MKLIYIQNVRIPTEKAHGIQIMKMCEAFAEAGNNVELVVPRRFNKIKENPFTYYGIPKVFKIKKLPCLDLIFLDKYLGHFSLWITSVTFSFFSFFYLLFEKADLIYTRDKFLLFLSLFKKNLFFEAHTFPKNYSVYSPFLKKLKGIVVITRKLEESFTGKGILAGKILVATDGVDITKFEIRSTKSETRIILNLPQDKKIALYTGHLYEWKGAGVLLAAARKFSIDNYQFSNYLFIFVGGTEKDIVNFKKQAENLNNILIIGHRPYSEMPYWLGAADVLVLPNSGKEEISKYWTSPMKMFEYMAARRPIVASDLPSLKEILNEENAFLVEPDDAEALAEGIRKVLEDPQLAERLSDQAFKDVQEYSWAKRVEKILAFAKS